VHFKALLLLYKRILQCCLQLLVVDCQNDMAKTPNSSPPTAFSDITDLFSEATILSDAPDGLLENHPAFSTPIRPPIEQDIIQEDYNEGE
jgi:hypothetical protein